MAYERIQEIQNPEIAIKRAILTYQLQGRSDSTQRRQEALELRPVVITKGNDDRTRLYGQSGQSA